MKSRSRVGNATRDLQIPPHTCMENEAAVLAAYPRKGEKTETVSSLEISVLKSIFANISVH